MSELAYPLSWPAGWPRTNAYCRERGSFDGTMDKVRRELLDEVDRIALGTESRSMTIRDYVVISTNMPLRRDGFPSASASAPSDPGVAIYFKRKGKPVCFACDKYDAVWKNMRAIQKTIEALRGIERWGSSQLLDRAFTGFTALPAPTGSDCWSVLGVSADATEDQVNAAYREKVKTAHPDAGGSSEAFTALNQARSIALSAVANRRAQ